MSIKPSEADDVLADHRRGELMEALFPVLMEKMNAWDLEDAGKTESNRATVAMEVLIIMLVTGVKRFHGDLESLLNLVRGHWDLNGHIREIK